MSLKIGGRFLRRTDVKLTGLYVLTFFLSSLILCGFLYFRLKHQLIKEVDRFLLDEINELSEVLFQDMKEKETLKRFEFGVASRTYYPLYFRVLDTEGAVFYASEGMREIEYRVDEKVMSLARKGRKNIEKIHSPGRRRPFRFVSAPLYREGKLVYIVQLGTHLRFIRKSLSGFKRNLLAAFPIVLVLGSLGGWILARRSLSPIGYIASKARSITSENLSARLNPRGTGDEMDNLIQTINGMIERLENSFKRMTEFTADASHEMKTPICAMRGEAEVLLSKGRGTEEYQEALAGFIDQFDRMNQMLNDLILLSKSDSSSVELRMCPVRLDLLLIDLLNLFQILADQKKIKLTVIAPLQEEVVMGDKMRLQQLFTNLMDNAIKYTGEGSVEVSARRDGNDVVVKIKDSGIGIPEEEREKIFKRFYRVDKSRSRETGGVGLGLSIAEWIVRAHQGKIEVSSEQNRGSTFAVYLPIYKA